MPEQQMAPAALGLVHPRYRQMLRMEPRDIINVENIDTGWLASRYANKRPPTIIDIRPGIIEAARG
jgi:hypothetical protein